MQILVYGLHAYCLDLGYMEMQEMEMKWKWKKVTAWKQRNCKQKRKLLAVVPSPVIMHGLLFLGIPELSLLSALARCQLYFMSICKLTALLKYLKRERRQRSIPASLGFKNLTPPTHTCAVR